MPSSSPTPIAQREPRPDRAASTPRHTSRSSTSSTGAARDRSVPRGRQRLDGAGDSGRLRRRRSPPAGRRRCNSWPTAATPTRRTWRSATRQPGRRLRAGAGGKALAGAGAAQGGGRSDRAREVRVWFNPRLESRDFMIPGIVALLLLVVTTNLSSMAHRAREGARHARAAERHAASPVGAHRRQAAALRARRAHRRRAGAGRGRAAGSRCRCGAACCCCSRCPLSTC